MSKRPLLQSASSRLVMLTLVGVTAIGFAACSVAPGGAATPTATPPAEPALSREALVDHLTSLHEREGARFAVLAEKAGRLDPDEPLPSDLRTGMADFASGLEREADYLSQVVLPAGTEGPVGDLIVALRARAEAFSRAASQDGVTLSELERQSSLERSGDLIDAALRRLRSAGLLPAD